MEQQEPRSRWFQYRLKTLFVLPVLVGLMLVLYLYWDDWRKLRPPHKYFDDEAEAVCMSFVEALTTGRLDDAYQLTSDRFKAKMSRLQFESLFGRHPALHELNESVGLRASYRVREFGHRYLVQGNGFALSVDVVIDDSFFYRHPHPPRVEQLQIEDVDQSYPGARRPL